MQEFFNYTSLSTLAGNVAATILIAQLIKKLKLIKKIPTQLLVLIISFSIITFTSAVTGKFSFKDIPLYLLNSILAASSAIGTYHTINSENEKKSKRVY
ncbi:hypothetical protein Q2T46_04515 [Thermoanaerobacterium sp. CMT5567-10]|uniref:hypothetical protein n=1 Tax=Thermoanaerobacterium sp. CMT5567-10 TaxID=3061989 RepID=UPI0026E106BD|nr:hypothetical protein [Thermoanaerobacterium sp. CMT5567-10]WKV09706.1 hypothetical protein Q2T46_04515 [Thermoanaerobacterium sp. CMT5567-10]